MISLEKKLLISVLSDMSKSTKSITPEDIETFFAKSKDKVRRLLYEKELYLRIARSSLKSLESKERENEIDAPDQLINQHLKMLHNQLEIATLEFKNRKEAKYHNLIRKLKVALSENDKDEVFKCLYNIDQLKQNLKTIEISELQQKVAECAEAHYTTDNEYYDLYVLHQERTTLMQYVNQIEGEVISLKLLLEAD